MLCTGTTIIALAAHSSLVFVNLDLFSATNFIKYDVLSGQSGKISWCMRQIYESATGTNRTKQLGSLFASPWQFSLIKSECMQKSIKSTNCIEIYRLFSTFNERWAWHLDRKRFNIGQSSAKGV